MIRKVYVCSYKKLNFGDDLFLHILATRYPCVKFCMYAPVSYKRFASKYKNIEVKMWEWKREKLNKVISVCRSVLYFKDMRENFLENLYASRCDAAIYIGGSLFIEPNKPKFTNRFFGGKPLFLLGANYGPERTIKYREYCRNYFKQYTDICFRDKKSYEIFNDLEQTRYSTDIAFSIFDQKGKIEKLEQNKVNVLIAPIDLSWRTELKKYVEPYEENIASFVRKMLENGNKVTFCSFCVYEGDKNCVDRIMKRVGKNENIKTLEYNGDIYEVLNEFQHSDFVVASRFHGVVMGLGFGKKVVPLCYSEKTINLLSDIGIECYDKIMDCVNYEEWKAVRIDEEKIADLARISRKQFQKFDNYLESMNRK